MKTVVIHEKQDLTYLNWSKIRHSSGTAGSFLKAASELSRTKTYYKLSNYDNSRSVVGHESVNELIVDRLLTVLGIEHLHYQLIHADILIDGKNLDTYVCAERFSEPLSNTRTQEHLVYDLKSSAYPEAAIKRLFCRYAEHFHFDKRPKFAPEYSIA